MRLRSQYASKRQPLELLSVEEMYRCDSLTIKGGTPGTELMENAGRAVARVAANLCADGRIAILCGPGNNGGDGFVAARALSEMNVSGDGEKIDVRVGLLGDIATLKGDAKWAADQWLNVPHAQIRPMTVGMIEGADLVIDALFGAGLARPVEGIAASILERINEKKEQISVLSVDVPSGIDGNTGEVRGVAVLADRTVTFFREKAGHHLLPGRMHCGVVDCVDIGIPENVLKKIGGQTFQNHPRLWRNSFPTASARDHKYKKGHAVVVSGGRGKTGAARLAATAALRVGAGLVTVAGPFSSIPELSSQLTTVMVAEVDQVETLRNLLNDKRKNAVGIGPGLGLGGVTRDFVTAVLGASCSVVLDADALTSFEGRGGALFPVIDERTVLTPHAGEFQRLFADLTNIAGGKVAAAREASRRSGGVIVLKGADTIVAGPDGRAAINSNAPPSLATAGAGDVLTGLITGLLAQGMPTWEAACAAVWLHGACASQLGRGLIAEDLSWALPDVLESAELWD